MKNYPPSDIGSENIIVPKEQVSIVGCQFSHFIIQNIKYNGVSQCDLDCDESEDVRFNSPDTEWYGIDVLPNRVA